MNQKGTIALAIPLLLILLVAALILYVLFSQGLLKSFLIPKSTTQSQTSIQPIVAPKTQYSNPFDKNTQYTNPFSDYQNPFDNLK